MSVIQAAQRAEERRQQALSGTSAPWRSHLKRRREATTSGPVAFGAKLVSTNRLPPQEAAIARLLTDIPRGKLSDELQDALHSAAEAARSDKHRSA